MSSPTPIELETREALAARERAFTPQAELTIEYDRSALFDELAPVVPLAARRRLAYVPPVVLDVSSPATLPALAVEIELLVDELLAVDLELEAWRADLTERIPS